MILLFKYRLFESVKIFLKETYLFFWKTHLEMQSAYCPYLLKGHGKKALNSNLRGIIFFMANSTQLKWYSEKVIL